MYVFWVSLMLVVGHFSMAAYGCLLVKDSFKFSKRAKKSLMIFCAFVPLVGFAVVMSLTVNKKRTGLSDSGAFGSSGYVDSDYSDGGGGE